MIFFPFSTVGLTWVSTELFIYPSWSLDYQTQEGMKFQNCWINFSLFQLMYQSLLFFFSSLGYFPPLFSKSNNRWTIMIRGAGMSKILVGTSLRIICPLVGIGLTYLPKTEAPPPSASHCRSFSDPSLSTGDLCNIWTVPKRLPAPWHCLKTGEIYKNCSPYLLWYVNIIIDIIHF